MKGQMDNQALKVIGEVKKAVIGKDDCIVKVMTAILAGGHILLEDIPGVGKTTMALAFSKAMALKESRIQFTPDVLPADITGFSMYKKEKGAFEYQPGAVMCNILLADEINRTSPKTQSALLQVMEEKKVTVDGVTRPVPEPFVVIATQNPVGSAGTQLLPESQLDRFMVCMTMGYPDMKYELEIVKGKSSGASVEDVRPVICGADLLNMQARVEEIYIHDAIYQYMGELVQATRAHAMIELGVSPRGTIAVARMVKALAYLRGRNYALPEDVTDIFIDVTAHRIRLNSKARVNHVTARAVLEEILERIPRPSVRRKQG
ncbi:MAG TPA: MoxR family ATPase [Candidatus Egerieimonas intestinavium]|uniref:MoxR family ATPase n=1 Tax=Candidatus Egerieimonas intestinavium TaxID=2840777 RepID=A0A9D1JF41_9FIRM|nr:MoxR family ATPase [Candidatus Egerieimonas intestinavium]